MHPTNQPTESQERTLMDEVQACICSIAAGKANDEFERILRADSSTVEGSDLNDFVDSAPASRLGLRLLDCVVHVIKKATKVTWPAVSVQFVGSR